MSQLSHARLLPAALCLSLLAAPAAAEGLALSLRAGTSGLGLEATRSISEHVNVRAGFGLLGVGGTVSANLSKGGLSGDVSFDARLGVRTASLLVDGHTGRGSFRLTGGLVLNGNTLELEARAAARYVINDEVYELGEVDSLTGDVTLGRRIAPYLGVGFGNATADGQRVTAVCDIGIIFHGAPSAELGATGSAAGSARLADDLAAAERKLNDEHFRNSYYHFYPVIALGVAVRLF